MQENSETLGDSFFIYKNEIIFWTEGFEELCEKWDTLLVTHIDSLV